MYPSQEKEYSLLTDETMFHLPTDGLQKPNSFRELAGVQVQGYSDSFWEHIEKLANPDSKIIPEYGQIDISTLSAREFMKSVPELSKHTENLFDREFISVEKAMVEVDGFSTEVNSVWQTKNEVGEEVDPSSLPTVFLSSGIFADFEMYLQYVDELVAQGYRVIGANFEHQVPNKIDINQYHANVTAAIVRRSLNGNLYREQNPENMQQSKIDAFSTKGTWRLDGHSRGTANVIAASEELLRNGIPADEISVNLINPVFSKISFSLTELGRKLSDIGEHAYRDIALDEIAQAKRNVADMLNDSISQGTGTDKLTTEKRIEILRANALARHLAGNIKPSTLIRQGKGLMDGMDETKNNGKTYFRRAIELANAGVSINVIIGRNDTVLPIDASTASELEGTPNISIGYHEGHHSVLMRNPQEIVMIIEHLNAEKAKNKTRMNGGLIIDTVG
jgi:hypothetical protein